MRLHKGGESTATTLRVAIAGCALIIAGMSLAWYFRHGAAQPAATIPGDGTYRVGVDIQPGLYVTRAGPGCYWERLSGLSGDFDDIIANGNAEGQGYVNIAPTDVAFQSSDCPTWTSASGGANAAPIPSNPIPATCGTSSPQTLPDADAQGFLSYPGARCHRATWPRW